MPEIPLPAAFSLPQAATFLCLTASIHSMSGSAFDIELDEFTLARARRGDVAACETVFRLFSQPAYAIAYRVCQCPELAQDVTQEAFISAFRRIRQFRGEAPFWGWLRRVVVNQAISALRRLPKHETVELDEFRASHQAVDEGDEQRISLSMDLESAFAHLDGTDRAVVWLHDVEGYSHKEIADLFGKTESFSKTRLSRAHARLRELIDAPASSGQNPARPCRSGKDASNSLTEPGSARTSPLLSLSASPL